MLQLPSREISCWREVISKPSYPSLTEDLEVDVVIVGAGISGLTAGYLLKNAGKTVAIIEKDAVASGTTGGTTGKVTSQHGLTYADLRARLGEKTARTYGQANEIAIAEIEKLINEEKIACDWQRDDNYVYTRDPEQLKTYQNEAEVAQLLGLPATFETITSLPFDITGAVRFANQAKFNSGKYSAGLAANIQGRDSYVFEHTRAIGIRDGSSPQVRTSNGIIRAKDIIVATNVPTLPLMARGGYCILEYPHKSYIVAARMDAGFNGMYISTDRNEYSILPIKSGGDNLLLVGGESHIRGAKLNKDTRYQRLADYAEERFNAPHIDFRWSAWDYQAYDDIPLVGRLYPWSKHLYVVTAFRKWGLSNSMVAATILRDLIIGQQNEGAEVYNSLRLQPLKSIPRVVAQYLK
jgi:glycine/D-amino acid oxidase-like deaminating enzyme